MNKEEFNEKIVEIVHSEMLNFSKDEIKWLYKVWFSGESSNGKWIQKKEVINSNQNVPDKAYLRGVDLPFYFGNIEASKKRIMIIGLDPLRSKSAFEKAEKSNGNKANIYEDVLLSTPYALHSKAVREGKTNNYWKIIEGLKDDNFIYLTDLYKTFFKTNVSSKVTRSYNYYKQENVSNNSREILLKEIELIKPDVIVTFGNDVKYAIGELVDKKIPTLSKESEIIIADNLGGIPILPFVHPAARYSKLKSFFINNDFNINEIKTKADYGLSFSKLIQHYLSK
ncbi:uracil-DNA glycosylase family protein [Mariniflexile sp.]|uniref:uracil-DNA glycosylase family protein n=1 Tax=Mariniflexile sp. TaxID=1979402 RepID=UPI004048365C